MKRHFLGKTRDVPKSTCLNCNEVAEAATPVSEQDALPEPGNITVCFKCGHLMAFADDLTLRALTGEEMVACAGDERIVAFQRARSGLHVLLNRKRGPP